MGAGGMDTTTIFVSSEYNFSYFSSILIRFKYVKYPFHNLHGTLIKLVFWIILLANYK